MVMASMGKIKNRENRKENKKGHSLQNISSCAKFAITTAYGQPEAQLHIANTSSSILP
jgi:hypothetical protein